MDNYRNIKSKLPWRKIEPDPVMSTRPLWNGSDEIAEPKALFRPVWQSDFLRQYYPSGHLINSGDYYPDIVREETIELTDENGVPTGETAKRKYIEHVPRYSFAFQQIITEKQLMHLCGNDIQFDVNITDPTQEDTDNITLFREGWLDKDMEVAFYASMKSVKITGDTAVVGYISDKKFGWKVLSYMKGDRLYPHYNSSTGELELFARAYDDYDQETGEKVEWLEVWDKDYFSRYKSDATRNEVELIFLGKYKMSGYRQVGYTMRHGYNRVPVSYVRDEDGACWSSAQDSIDGYELAFSQMAHNNEAFGEPILYLQGDEIEATNGLNGTIKVLSMGRDDKAGYLQGQSAAESYTRQLELNYKMIYEQTFTVIPPELKSGDLPAAALKILYSPAYEKASNDAQKYQKFLNDLVDMFAYGYGMEVGKTIDFANIPMKCWIKPYVHVNYSAEVADLATAVQNGFCSKETASERISYYTCNDEWDRINKEEKEAQQSDLLYQIKSEQASADIQSQNQENTTSNSSNEDK